MSWYRVVITFVISAVIGSVSLQSKELIPVSEDELIMRGLWFDDQKAFAYSRAVYGKLFDMTGEREFLFREVTAALLSRTYINKSIIRLKKWDKQYPNSLEAKRLLIPLYLTIDNAALAKEESEYLLERSKDTGDLELASNSYLYTGDFDKALSLLEQVYQETLNEQVLLRVTTVMDEYTNQRKEAIALLEMHRRMNVTTDNVYLMLLQLYIKENNIDGLLTTYEALYAQNSDERYLRKILDIYVYKKDILGAIGFLEKQEGKQEILYDLYKAQKFFDKALLLVDQFYEKDKDPKWLAEKGMLLFEKAEDKNDKKMLADVVSYFEKAMTLGIDDSVYLNYYGYTLIDKEYDIGKGMKIIQKAIKQQPDNTYYLDSLAWGYYKQRECKKAYELMKKVIKIEGLEQEDIIEHWNAIDKCQKKEAIIR